MTKRCPRCKRVMVKLLCARTERIAKAERRVVKAAKRWGMLSGPTLSLQQAIDALVRAERGGK